MNVILYFQKLLNDLAHGHPLTSFSPFLKIYFSFLFICMCIPHLWVPKRSEEGIVSPVAEDRGGYDPPDEGAGIC